MTDKNDFGQLSPWSSIKGLGGIVLEEDFETGLVKFAIWRLSDSSGSS